MNKSQRGNYYCLKTKKWFEADGYIVEKLEKQYRIFDKGRIFFVKKDLWGADLVAKNKKEMIFIQVKSNEGDISKGIKELKKTIWPSFIRLMVVFWPRMAREPQITEVTTGMQERCALRHR